MSDRLAGVLVVTTLRMRMVIRLQENVRDGRVFFTSAESMAKAADTCEQGRMWRCGSLKSEDA